MPITIELQYNRLDLDGVYSKSESYLNRNQEFQLANEIVKTPNSDYHNAWGALEYVLQHAHDYIEDCAQKVLVFLNKKEYKTKFLPYSHRFLESYTRRAVRKLKKITYPHGLFL
ncbi:MAG: hypothetical protein QW478_07210, partial [Candidatus Micrarchaeaceae archaeon]